MNPQEYPSAFELPPAQTAEQNGQQSHETKTESINEKQGAIAIEQGVVGQAALQQVSAVTPPVQVGDDGQVAQTVSNVTMGSPQIADDNDLIEKEWVIHAKEIVARTAHDPHLQNKELNKFKADYLKKRYNKDIKLEEDT